MSNEIKSIVDFFRVFKDEDTCIKYMEKMRFPNGVVCHNCKSCNESTLLSTRNVYKCKKCKKQFSIKKGTIFEDCKLPLQKCFAALWLITSSKKGMSSIQLSTELGTQQRSAWFLMHRIRTIIENADLTKSLTGIVEVDETFIGGKEKNKHESKKLKQGRGTTGKTPVVGAISREDKQVIAYPVKEVSRDTAEVLITNKIAKGSMIYADDASCYNGLVPLRVKHSKGEYVRGDIHTNSIESFWATVKRGYIEIYHYWSKKHLKRYINEFVFRYNNKDNNIIKNIDILLANSSGKRLTYKELIR